MDMEQCNDAYGAIRVAVALADAFGCSVNELPLSFVLSGMNKKQSVSCPTLFYTQVSEHPSWVFSSGVPCL